MSSDYDRRLDSELGLTYHEITPDGVRAQLATHDRLLPPCGGVYCAIIESRIDLSIGRAPGSDPVTSILLRGAAGRDDRDTDRFPDYLDHVRAMISAPGVPVQLREGDYILRATPAAATEPRLWLLGSSLYSAPLTAAKGLPYVFANSTLELLAKEL